MDLVSHALREQSVLFNYRYIIQPVSSFYWAAKVCREKMLPHIPRLSICSGDRFLSDWYR